jgi:hypothetical protein
MTLAFVHHEPCKMTLKIEKSVDGHGTGFRLIGRMRLPHLVALKAQIEHPEKSQPISVSGVQGRHPVRFVWYSVLPRGLGADCQVRSSIFDEIHLLSWHASGYSEPHRQGA